MSTAISFQDFVSGLPLNYLECRAEGHGRWRALTARWDKRGGVDQRRQCNNCGTVKPQSLDSEGYLVDTDRGYEYPDGYLATNVDLPDVGAQRAAYRLALARRRRNEPRRRAVRRAS